MSKKSKILMFAASLILIFSFFFPIWKINLEAPQYPEGIGMRIWLHQITGYNEHDLQNINGLNHYIGMKAITPESIPELQIMPYIIAFLILLGITAAVLGKKLLVKIWIILFFILGAAGLVDYYLWGYDYGHDLDPTAPIKVPGMTYQPPLIGSKQLLNINAVSLPDAGTYIMFFSIAIALLILFKEKGRDKNQTKKAVGFKSVESIAFLAAAFFISACQSGPQPIEYGKDSCDNCKMLITDSRYGSQLVTDKGKVFRFDAVECLGEYIVDNNMEENENTSLYVSDFFEPATLINVKNAEYLHNDDFRSPMGLNVLATNNAEKLKNFFDEHSGALLDWQGVLELIKSEM